MVESSSTHSDPVLVAGNEDLINYREPSRAAVVSLLLGVLSIVVVFSVFFLLLPILAIVAAAVGLWRIKESDYLTGRGMALAGLGLGAFWASFAVVAFQVEDRTTKNAAQELATPWVEMLIDGHLLQAHQLMMPAGARLGPDTDLVNHYETHETAGEELDSLQQNQVVNRLEEQADRNLAPIPTGRATVQRAEGAWYVHIDYQLQDVATRENVMTVRVGMQRTEARGEEGPYFTWRATGIELVD